MRRLTHMCCPAAAHLAGGLYGAPQELERSGVGAGVADGEPHAVRLVLVDAEVIGVGLHVGEGCVEVEG